MKSGTYNCVIHFSHCGFGLRIVKHNPTPQFGHLNLSVEYTTLHLFAFLRPETAILHLGWVVEGTGLPHEVV